MDRDRFPAPFGRKVMQLASVCQHSLNFLKLVRRMKYITQLVY